MTKILLLETHNDFSAHRFLFKFGEQMGSSSDVPSESLGTGEFVPLSPDAQKEADKAQDERVQQVKGNAEKEEQERVEGGFDATNYDTNIFREIAAVEGTIGSVLDGEEIDIPEERELELRTERQTKELSESFVGRHVIRNLPEVNAGRNFPRTPDDNWFETGAKGLSNTLTAF